MNHESSLAFAPFTDLHTQHILYIYIYIYNAFLPSFLPACLCGIPQCVPLFFPLFLTISLKTCTMKIKREISTMKIVKHPNIIQLYEVMASKSNVYFVLEYVTGGELFNKIVSSKAPLPFFSHRIYMQTNPYVQTLIMHALPVPL